MNKRIQLAIDNSCDYCPDEDIPLCVKACVFGARGFIKRERVK
jgi:carbon-monoxide dehydrogenase iron sulfur subunit